MNRFTVVFETDTDPAVVFSDIKVTFGEVLGIQVQRVGNGE